jgi:xanthine dehydrogenase iron-sulfur cluster and FAD-binding subunit A
LGLTGKKEGGGEGNCGACTVALGQTQGQRVGLSGQQQLHAVQENFSGELCRCTGYRPILDAAQHMARLSPVFFEATDLLLKVELLSTASHAPEPTFSYTLPQTLADAFAAPGNQRQLGAKSIGHWCAEKIFPE